MVYYASFICTQKAHCANSSAIRPDMDKHVLVSRGEKCSFFGKFGVLWFLVTPILRFALLPYYRRNMPEYGFSLTCTFLYKKTRVLAYFI